MTTHLITEHPTFTGLEESFGDVGSRMQKSAERFQLDKAKSRDRKKDTELLHYIL